MNKYVAEAIGTFALSFAVLLSLASTLPLETAVLAALVVGLFVYTIGPISGCHINPAVTVAALSLKLITTKDAVGYVVAQALGGAAAFFLASLIFDTMPSAGANVNDFRILLAEAIGAFFLTFGIAAVVFNKVPAATSGLTIGASLLVGIMMAAGLGSAGILNPAVAFALNSFNALYLFGPMFGAVVGMWAYRIISTPLE